MAGGAYAGGSDFRVNTTTIHLQTDPAVAALNGGGFVMCWTDNSGLGGDTSGSSIKAQMYDGNGQPVGTEFLVNTTTNLAQEQASVSALASGGFVVTWTDNSGTGPDPDKSGIKAQIYNASGAKVGGEFLVNTTTKLTQSDAVITGLASGGFLVSWVDASGTGVDSKGTGVRAQLYSASGAKIGGEFLINTTIASSQLQPAVASLASGGFVATWTDFSGLGGDSTPPGIKAQIFSATGAKVGAEFLVNSAVASTQDQPSIANLSSGGFVIVWRDLSGQGDGSASGVKGQVYDASGARVGGEFLVNTTQLNSQDLPVVTGLPGGGFAVSWRDNSNLVADVNGFGIKSQVFDAQGNKLGGEFQVNTSVAGNQEQPTIAALSSGALVVGWADATLTGVDTDGAIRARILQPTAGTISDVAVSSTVLSEAVTQNTTIANLSANGAVNAVDSYQIIDDSTGGAFAIVGSRLVVRNSLGLDYESASSATLTIRATDTFGNTFDKVVGLSITDSLLENRYGAGAETLVNTTTAGGQQQSAIAAGGNGRFAVAWADGSGQGDTSSNGIKFQLVDSDGNKIGTELQINTQTLNSQDNPAVAALAAGGYVVTWADGSGVGGDTSNYGVKAQIVDANGAPVGSEFLVNQVTAGAQRMPAVAALASGGFIVTWYDASGLGADTSSSGIKAQIYDPAGNRVGGEFLVNTTTLSTQDTPTVAALNDGGFVVSWHDLSLLGGDSSKDSVKAQLYDASGNRVGGEVLVNTQVAGNQQQEAIAGLASGGYVIAWADASQIGGDPDYYGIKLQIYDADGNRVGDETLANTTTLGGQIAPTVSALADGGFIVSWADYSGIDAENGTPGIKAQIFAANGTKIGEEFAVNDEVLSTQSDPAIAADASGHFAISWTDYSAQGGDGSPTSVKLRTFNQLGSQGGPAPLIATADALTGTEDQTVVTPVAQLLANDIDSNALALTLVSVAPVSGGSVALDGTGNVVFTPNANFNGNALYTYVVSDDAGLTATGRVSVNIAPVNDAPVANDDHVNISEDGDSFQGAVITANDVDVDLGDKITIQTIPATTTDGVPLTFQNNIVGYLPGSLFQSLAAGETASDSFAYTIVDQGGLTSSATVYLNVVGANDAPTNLTLSGSQVDENAANGTVVGTLAASDVDHGSVLTYSLSNSAGGRFGVDPATGIVTVTNGSLLDYETSPTQKIVGRATDQGGLYVETNFTIGLNDLPEPKSWTGDNGINVYTARTNDLWTLNGLGGADTLTGNASSDTIYGGAGNDALDGAGGADVLVGGIGNDIYFVDNSADQIVENYGEGTDLVYASANYSLSANVENLTLTGTANLNASGNDTVNTIIGTTGDNSINGGAGGDYLQGMDGNDALYGEAGNDVLAGGNGADLLSGGAGADQLTGGAGADNFLMDSLTVSADFDTVKDFTPGEDIITFSRAVFTAFATTPLGALPSTYFRAGAGAGTADQHIIYNPSTGNLYYDSDGSGPAAMVQIAFLGGKPTLTSSSFMIG